MRKKKTCTFHHKQGLKSTPAHKNTWYWFVRSSVLFVADAMQVDPTSLQAIRFDSQNLYFKLLNQNVNLVSAQSPKQMRFFKRLGHDFVSPPLVFVPRLADLTGCCCDFHSPRMVS